MMNNFIHIAIAISAIAVITIIQNLINLKKSQRYKQMLLPGVFSIFSIIAVFVGVNYFDDLGAKLTNFDFLINSDIFVINILVAIALVFIKLIIVPVVEKLYKNEKIEEIFTSSFYEYDDFYDEYFLKNEKVGYRSFFFFLICGCIFTFGIFLGLTWTYGIDNILWLKVFPCAVMFIINEFYSYINGKTKEEFDNTFSGQGIGFFRISNYYKVREVLEQLLPNVLLTSHTGMEYMRKSSSREYINSLKNNNDKTDSLIAEFFEMNERYKSAERDYIEGTVNLMHRKNVVVFNPFYRDLSMYITLPMVSSLLSGKKCLVIVGRQTTCDDVKLWLEDFLSEYSHSNLLWRVMNLSVEAPQCEVGVLSFHQIYDDIVLKENRDFFKDVDFVLMMEPSVMLNTGQISLSNLASEMNHDNEKPVYCICDRNVEGLIDTMSHILRDSITEVVATPVPRCIYSTMSWDAHGDYLRQHLFDKQTKYFGNGVELAAIAIKNQIPKVEWYGESKVPILDIRWLAGQHYSTICRYMNIPAQQSELNSRIEYHSNLWRSSIDDEAFLIIEDEFSNMFSTLKSYLSRGRSQSFVNVLSENYMLRDYMRCNKQLFMSNPCAIPSVVPDYSRTEKNTLIKLLISMTYRPVSEEEVIKEFQCVDIYAEDAFELINNELKKYTNADISVINVKEVKRNIDEYSTASRLEFSISKLNFDYYFSKSLKNAYFVVEGEKQDEEYINARLFGHVVQLVLPGQFVSYNGKYYIVKYISPQSGVVLRRASDLFDSRKYYRQIRKYCFNNECNDKIVDARTVMDVDIQLIEKDFSIITTGYLELTDIHNLRTARLVDLSDSPDLNNFERNYSNKNILRIRIPDASSEIRFTLCLLISEVFRTMFPDGWQYLAVVSERPSDVYGMLDYMVYDLELNNDDSDNSDEYIYIIEDSEMDLGLLEAVDKNLMKVLEIVTDYLDWHFEKMRESSFKDPEPVSTKIPKADADISEKTALARIGTVIKRLFERGKEVDQIKVKIKADSDSAAIDESDISDIPDVDDENNIDEYSLDNDYSSTDIESNLEERLKVPTLKELGIKLKDQYSQGLESGDVYINENSETENEGIVDAIDEELISGDDDTDIFEPDGTGSDDLILEDQLKLAGLMPINKSRYQEECFLKFGFDEIDSRLKIEDVRNYLRVRGWSNNSLTKARKRDSIIGSELDIEVENYCDFCGLPLTGVSYEMLSDGRIRCNECSNTVIASVEEVKELFNKVIMLMGDFYKIQYRKPIGVRLADAKEIGKSSGMVFVPSTEFDARVLGYAQKKGDQYNIVLENGSPRLAAIETIVHEMTHIWQYLNWNDDQIREIFKMENEMYTKIARDTVYEGMATWSAVQYLYLIGEFYHASQMEKITESRNDVYGIGFKIFKKQYPFNKYSGILKFSPFHAFPPVEPSDVFEAVKQNFEVMDK